MHAINTMNDEHWQDGWGRLPAHGLPDVAEATAGKSQAEGAAATGGLSSRRSSQASQDSTEEADALPAETEPLALYLREISRVPLLQPAEEIALARAIEQSNQALAEFARGDVSPSRSCQARARSPRSSAKSAASRLASKRSGSSRTASSAARSANGRSPRAFLHCASSNQSGP